MLFRTGDGKLIELKKFDFINDKLYYEKLVSVIKIPKSEKTFEDKQYEQTCK